MLTTLIGFLTVVSLILATCIALTLISIDMLEKEVYS